MLLVSLFEEVVFEAVYSNSRSIPVASKKDKKDICFFLLLHFYSTCYPFFCVLHRLFFVARVIGTNRIYIFALTLRGFIVSDDGYDAGVSRCFHVRWSVAANC